MPSPAQAIPLTVLIADDAPPVAEMLSALISAPGRIEVIGVGESQDEVIESIRRLRPDVVVLDLQLKSGSGTEVIKAVRADPGMAAIRILVTSNHASPQLRAGCLALGADGYFDKVKELSALTDALSRLAGDKRRGS